MGISDLLVPVVIVDDLAGKPEDRPCIGWALGGGPATIQLMNQPGTETTLVLEKVVLPGANDAEYELYRDLSDIGADQSQAFFRDSAQNGNPLGQIRQAAAGGAGTQIGEFRTEANTGPAEIHLDLIIREGTGVSLTQSTGAARAVTFFWREMSGALVGLPPGGAL